MADNVVDWPGVTSLPITVERILEVASRADLKMVIIIGEFENGDRYFGSSIAGGPEVLWALEKAKLDLLDITE